MSGKLIDLRKRAEGRLSRRREPRNDGTRGGTHALADELEVTRIELDLQREDIEQHRHDLESLRHRYTALCDSAPVGILTLDARSRIIDGNETAWRLLGFHRSSERLSELTLVLHWKDADRLRCKLRVAKRSVMELPIRPPRGEPFRALVVLEPVRDRPGKFHAAIVDTTSREETDQPSTIPHVDAAAVSVVVVDDDAGNRAHAVAVLEDEGYRVLSATSGDEAIALVAAEPPECILMDVRMPNVDGIAACKRIRAMPGGSDIAIVFVTAQRDVDTFDRALAAGSDDFITRPFLPAELLVRVQTALRLRKIAIERGELYAQLKHQRDALQRLELQKEQLIAFLVHDLKNPVHAIDLHALNALRADDHERSRRALARIGEETRALLRMISNLLDISKADEGQLAPAMREVDPTALVDSALEDLRTRAQSAGVRVQTTITTPRFHADPELIARVIANLVDNAIRHAPEDSEIRVSLAPSYRGVELRVADAGPGVSWAARDTVFERFRSGSGATHTNRGLGLAFCKLAVEAHHGRIWIEDASPGAVFCVSLPSSSRS
jgi:two-component system, sensor histidine kinase and response regulator